MTICRECAEEAARIAICGPQTIGYETPAPNLPDSMKDNPHKAWGYGYRHGENKMAQHIFNKLRAAAGDRVSVRPVSLDYKTQDGWHIFTSDDEPGLYVASKDLFTAVTDVAPALAKLRELDSAAPNDEAAQVAACASSGGSLLSAKVDSRKVESATSETQGNLNPASAPSPVEQLDIPAMLRAEDLPGMLAVAKGVAKQKWPHTMDAGVWAKEFSKTFAELHEGCELDEGWLIGWFANAIMAGYDTANQRAAAPAAPAEAPQSAGMPEVDHILHHLQADGSLDRGAIADAIRKLRAFASAEHAKVVLMMARDYDKLREEADSEHAARVAAEKNLADAHGVAQACERRAEAAERALEEMRPKGMLDPLRKIGPRLRGRFADRFFCGSPQQFTDHERQVMMEALRVLDAALAAKGEHQ